MSDRANQPQLAPALPALGGEYPSCEEEAIDTKLTGSKVLMLQAFGSVNNREILMRLGDAENLVSQG
jgi:hypothetical protein